MSIQSQNELRVEVAELCGRLFGWIVVDHKFCVIAHADGPVDLLTDLNACHQMETFAQKRDSEWCVDYANYMQDNFRCSRYGLIHATAEQRCRAFVKTMEGK